MFLKEVSGEEVRGMMEWLIDLSPGPSGVSRAEIDRILNRYYESFGAVGFN